MFTILLTARSWPTIFPKSRRSKSRTSELRISGSSRTSSETKGLTIALYLFSGPSWPSITALLAQSLTYYVQIVCQSNAGVDITHVLYFGRQPGHFGGTTIPLRVSHIRVIDSSGPGL